MLLMQVKPSKTEGKYYIDVQNGDKAYRSAELNQQETSTFCEHVVDAMLASASSKKPLLNGAIPEPVELKKPLKDGVGLSDDHRELILVKKGVVEVLFKGPRWRTASELTCLVGKAVLFDKHFKGEWA